MGRGVLPILLILIVNGYWASELMDINCPPDSRSCSLDQTGGAYPDNPRCGSVSKIAVAS